MAENTVARERRYLSHKMQASARYQIPQRRNNASVLPRLIPLSREDVFVCRRCGEGCTNLHYCKARDRQCFSCRQYGHYSKFCEDKLSRKTTGLVAIAKSVNKTKSSRKQQRDKIRYIQFKERKAVCFIMPFYTTSDEELQSNATIKTKMCYDVQDLKEENALLKRENKDLWDQMDREQDRREEHHSKVLKFNSYSNKNAELQKENATQVSEIASLNQQNNTNEIQIKTQDIKIQDLNSKLISSVKIHEEKIQELNSMLNTTSRQHTNVISELQKAGQKNDYLADLFRSVRNENGSLQEQLDEALIDLETKTRNSESITQISSKLQKALNEISQQKKRIQNLKSQLREAEQYIDRFQNRDQKCIKGYSKSMMCQRCGNDYKHPINECRAIGAVCQRCGGLDHLAAFCNSKRFFTNWNTTQLYCFKCGDDNEHLPSMCSADTNMCKICCIPGHFTVMHHVNPQYQKDYKI